MSDDFFSKLDSMMQGQQQVQRLAGERRLKDEAASKVVVTTLKPIATQYADELQRRRIMVEVTGNERILQFMMRWRNGDPHGISISVNYPEGNLKVERTSTDHTTKGRLTSSELYPSARWNDRIFVDELEKLINEYVLLAPKHGGLD